MVRFEFDITPFKGVSEIHLITIDEYGNKIDRIGLEDIQDQPTKIVLEIRSSINTNIKKE